MSVLREIEEQAARDKRRIVLPEGGDERVAAAAGEVARRGLAEVVVLAADESAALESVSSVDVRRPEVAQRYAAVLMRARRGLTEAQALAQVREPLTLAACMVACGDADGCVAGAAHTTAQVVRAALRVVGVAAGDGGGAGNRSTHSSADTQATAPADTPASTPPATPTPPSPPPPAAGLVSSFFIMQHDLPHQAIRGAAVFADCAMVIDPDAAQLARIAVDSADSAAGLLGLVPRVALLSFSTAGSAAHAQVDKVRAAGEIVAAWRPDLALMTEVQFDAAVDGEILRRKAPRMAVSAPANVFVFPDLQSANIGYKIAERIGGVGAVGPILQGLRRPVNDLSRGCRVADIVALVAVTAVQAQRG